MTKYILLFTTMILIQARADVYEQRLQTILSASSATQLERKLTQLSQDQRDERICRVELKWERVPIHCLARLHTSHWKNEEDHLHWQAMISRLCQRAVAQLESGTEIRTILPQVRADNDCFEAAKQRKQRFEYMHPEILTEAFATEALQQ
jgi:hypothetical protein